MGRQFKVLLIGAAFTVVAMGFAYAVPRAMHSAANEPPRNSIVLLTGGNESPSGSPEGSGDAVRGAWDGLATAGSSVLDFFESIAT